MSFIWPLMLIFLLVVPLLVLLYRRLQVRRQQAVARYGSFGLVQTGGVPLGKRRHVPAALFLAGLTLLIVALARPQMVVSLPKVHGTVILAFDVSGSMAATDFEPTRMEAAKAIARDFVQRQPSTIQIGVVAFSAGGFAVQVPTNDQAEILAAINRISPQTGTSLGQGIQASLQAIEAAAQPNANAAPDATPTPVPQGSGTSAAIVLLTDGENNINPDPFEAAQAAAERGVRIDTIGVGSAAGTTLQLEGFSVHTQLDEATLQGIAQIAHGTYYNAQNQDELRNIYDNINLQLVIESEPTEITALLAGLGLLVLMIGAVCSLLWFGRVP